MSVTYYPDLSQYEYSGVEEGVLNVGWLEKGHAFPVGDVPVEVIDSLVRLAAEPVNVYRGMHFCDFCRTIQDARYAMYYGNEFLGTGEIRVRDRGVVFAAPRLIIHYIVDHGYRPPDEFMLPLLEG